MTLQRWAVQPPDFDRTVAGVGVAGLTDTVLGRVYDMSRTTPGGDTLRWRLTRRLPLPQNGVPPFLIDWQDSPHPSTVSMPTVELRDFRAVSSDPAGTSRVLGLLGAPEVPVDPGTTPGLRAVFRGADGEFTVESQALAL